MGNYSEYTTKIFLNDSQAENKLTKLKDQIKQLCDEKAKALNAGDMSSFKKAEKNIRACEKEMKVLSTTSQSVDRVLSNLSDSSIKDIQRTIKAINKELSDGSIERNTNEWKFLNEQLKRAKDELRAIKGESEEASSKGFFDNAVDHIKKSWKTITKIGVGITIASKTIAPVIRDYAQLEQEMANVRK